MPDWGTIARRPANAVPTGPDAGIWAGARRTPVADPQDNPDDLTEPKRTGISSGFYEPPADEGPSGGLLATLAGGGLLAAGLMAKRPGTVMNGVRAVGRGIGNARLVSMLSGLAPVKSALGNLGAPLIEGLERGSTKPMQEFLSRQTVLDWMKAIKDRDTGMVQGSSAWNLPGRIMGAGDYATQQALKRAGLTEQEVQSATLQAPLPVNFGRMGTVLDGPVAETLIPFRRTPFNQFWEGMKTLSPRHEHKIVTAGMGAVGAATGAATADDDYPTVPGLVAATAGRYGIPVALGAILGRLHMANGQGGGGIAGSVLPVSEYGFEESLANPLRPLDPKYWGIVRAYRRVVEGR